MAKTILKELTELIEANVISEETAEKIRGHYQSKPSQDTNRLVVLFGIFGAILTGLGIILIIAHNWDEMPKGLKLLFSFLPLIAGQLACGFALLRKKDNSAWRESAAAFLFFAVGACIALVSQVYNIEGNLASFLFTWMLLCMPLIFVFNSGILSLLYLIGISWYAVDIDYFTYPGKEAYPYWLLLLPVLWYYFNLLKKRPGSNFVTFHNWFVPLSVTVVLGTLAKSNEDLIVLAYVCFFSLIYLIGESSYFSNTRLISNGWLMIGSAGTISMLLGLSFDDFWNGLNRSEINFSQLIAAPEFYTVIVITIAASLLLYLNNRGKPKVDFNPFGLIFILFIFIYIIGHRSTNLPVLLVNMLVFLGGVFTIRKGSRQDHLGVLNYGLLVITVLIVCRFFDTNLSFVARGLLFISVGIGFFIANNRMIKKRRAYEK